MAEQVDLGFPYYIAKANNNSSEVITVTFTVDMEGSLGGVSNDDVADAVRGYLAGLSGVTASSLRRRSVSETSL